MNETKNQGISRALTKKQVKRLQMSVYKIISIFIFPYFHKEFIKKSLLLSQITKYKIQEGLL